MKKYILLLAGLGLLLASCQKYLNVKQTSSQIFLTNAVQCQELLNVTSTMNYNYPSDQEISCDDYFEPDNLYSGQNGDDQKTYTWDPYSIHTSANPFWLGPYQVVEQSNLILETVPKITDGAPVDTLNSLKGQALFFRAYAFWELAQLYCKPYSASAGTDPGIPIRLSSDISGQSVRGTVQQTYDQVLSDLKQAVNLLPENVPFPTRPSKGAGNAMLARVYLSMSDYTDALVSSTAALTLNNQLTDLNTLDPNSDFPFARFVKDEYFHSVANCQNSILDEDVNPSDIDTNIINSYVTNDLRKGVYLTPYGASAYFTGNYEASYSQFFCGLATDEIYLTRAECYARAGDIPHAMDDLNTLLKTRWVTGTYVDMTAATTDDAIALILAERRKELVMRFTRWTDLRRLNQDPKTAVTLTRIVNGTTYTLPPNDLRYTLLIPYEVIQNSSIAQNPR